MRETRGFLFFVQGAKFSEIKYIIYLDNIDKIMLQI